MEKIAFFASGVVIRKKDGSDTRIDITMSETKMKGTVKKVDNLLEANKQL